MWNRLWLRAVKLTHFDLVAFVEDVEHTLKAARMGKARDPRDRVFATRSLMERLGIEMPALDYRKTLEEVYAEATAAVLRRSCDETFLCMASCQNHSNDMPSWAFDWCCATPRTASLMVFGGVLDRRENPIRVNGRLMFVKGFRLGQLRVPKARRTLKEPSQYSSGLSLEMFSHVLEWVRSSSREYVMQSWPKPWMPEHEPEHEPDKDEDAAEWRKATNHWFGVIHDPWRLASTRAPSETKRTCECHDNDAAPAIDEVDRQCVLAFFELVYGAELARSRYRKPATYRSTRYNNFHVRLEDAMIEPKPPGYQGAPLCLDSSGRLCYVLGKPQDGDVVILLEGTASTYVLRKKEQGFRLVGRCHLFQPKNEPLVVPGAELKEFIIE